MNTYVSTGAFKSNKLREILSGAEDAGIFEIELAPGMDYSQEVTKIIEGRSERFSFLLHNYFPTPTEGFALNLASDDVDTIKKSLYMCKANIDLSKKINAAHYSIHCGYCFRTDGRHLGNDTQTRADRIPIERAKEIFVENIQIVSDYAEAAGVRILLENNVVAEFAAGEKELFLGTTAPDLCELIELINRDNVGILLDLAHAKVSSESLQFDVNKMIETLKDKVLEVHVSDNDGRRDLNLPLTKDSDILRWIHLLKDKTITLEAYNLSSNRIKEQIELIEGAREGKYGI